MRKLRKAVIPVAGLGTRFLPATKSMPKEMLTVVDKPILHYAVEEAYEAGIEHFVLVTGRNKSAIEDYFDMQPELLAMLEKSGKSAQLELLRDLQPRAGSISYTRQQSPEGLGHAVWCARDIVGDEPFALLLPDMVSFGDRGCLAQIVETYNSTGGNVIAVENCAPHETDQYGIVGRGAEIGTGFQITEMVEKPAPGVAPSNMYINGRYILQPEIFDILGSQTRGAGNEIQLTDAMARLMAKQAFYGRQFNGRMFDCGSKLGFIQANIAFALQRPELRNSVMEGIRSLVEPDGMLTGT